jgi:hypothetical protein
LQADFDSVPAQFAGAEVGFKNSEPRDIRRYWCGSHDVKSQGRGGSRKFITISGGYIPHFGGMGMAQNVDNESLECIVR